MQVPSWLWDHHLSDNLQGVKDSIFPIEDSLLCLERGGTKEGRFFSGPHMGEPGATKAVHDWIDQLVASAKL